MGEIGFHVGWLLASGEQPPRFLQELRDLALKKCNVLQGNKKSTEESISYLIDRIGFDLQYPSTPIAS